jgi:hypothetical protein
MSLQVVPPSPMTLGEVSVAASVATSFLIPLSAQLDLAIFGPFGLGALQADLSAEFNTALALSANLSLSITNPIASYQQALAALVQVAATIQLALSAGIPTIGVEIGASISASAALTASLGVKLGGISALVEAALQVKLGAGQFIGELQASLGAGPVDVLTFGFDTPMTAAQVGTDALTLFQALPGIQATDNVSGIMIVTKNPAAAAAISALFKVS